VRGSYLQLISVWEVTLKIVIIIGITLATFEVFERWQ